MLPEYSIPILNAHHSTILGLGISGGLAVVFYLPRVLRWCWNHLHATLMVACVAGIAGSFIWIWR